MSLADLEFLLQCAVLLAPSMEHLEEGQELQSWGWTFPSLLRLHIGIRCIVMCFHCDVLGAYKGPKHGTILEGLKYPIAAATLASLLPL